MLPLPIIDGVGDQPIGLIGYGSTDPAIQEARDRLRERGIETDYMRIRAIPFSDEVAEFIRSHDRLYVIEMNHQGQIHKLLQLDVPEEAVKLISLTHNNGLPLSARWITAQIEEKESK
jgi:2-oxoglutarate ferredoxin oxidoreductase subunit alpha